MDILSLPLEDLVAILSPLTIKDLIAFGIMIKGTTFLLSERLLVSRALDNSGLDLPLLYFLLLTSPTYKELSKLRLLLTAHPDWVNRPIGMRWIGDKEAEDYMLLPLELARNKGAIQTLISYGAV
jgi:hypothetical protein